MLNLRGIILASPFKACKLVTSKRLASDSHCATKVFSVDVLTSPEGCWKDGYDKRQREHNMDFIGGIAFFISTIMFGYFTEKFEFNNNPPDTPLEIDSYEPEKPKDGKKKK